MIMTGSSPTPAVNLSKPPPSIVNPNGSGLGNININNNTNVPPSLAAQTEKSVHYSLVRSAANLFALERDRTRIYKRYLKEFRVDPCPLFKQHQCHQHRPYTCFHWHFANQRRRRPLRRRDGTFNYSPDIYCTKYDENTGQCPEGDEYLKEFRVDPCPLFKQHQCHQHRPYTCFHWHFANQRRRRPLRRRDGTFNYSPDIYCTKYDENTGQCPEGDDCPFLHRVAGDVERKYHLRYYKTALCVHHTDSKGQCVKNGVHCAFAHSPEDLRLPIFDIREIQQNGEFSDPNSEILDQKDRTSFVVEDPVWQDQDKVLACYKTEPCKKPPRLCRQGYACPYFHNGKDRRRPPGLFKYRSTPCPGAKTADEWAEQDSCENGEQCGYCHSRTEQQFHPEIYKSTKCNDMLQHGYCPRGPFCAFAHTDCELHTERESKKPEECSNLVGNSNNGKQSSSNGTVESSFPQKPTAGIGSSLNSGVGGSYSSSFTIFERNGGPTAPKTTVDIPEAPRPPAPSHSSNDNVIRLSTDSGIATDSSYSGGVGVMAAMKYQQQQQQQLSSPTIPGSAPTAPGASYSSVLKQRSGSFNGAPPPAPTSSLGHHPHHHHPHHQGQHGGFIGNGLKKHQQLNQSIGVIPEKENIGSNNSCPRAPGFEREHQLSPTRLWTPEISDKTAIASRLRTTSLNLNPNLDLGCTLLNDALGATPPTPGSIRSSSFSPFSANNNTNTNSNNSNHQKQQSVWPIPTSTGADLVGSGPLGSLLEDMSLDDAMNPIINDNSQDSEKGKSGSLYGSSAPVSIPRGDDDPLTGNNLGLFPSSGGEHQFRMSGSFDQNCFPTTGGGGGNPTGSGLDSTVLMTELARAKEELASHRGKLSAWEDGLKQARQACEAWKREAENHRRRTQTIEGEKEAAIAERDAALQQLAMMRTEFARLTAAAASNHHQSQQQQHPNNGFGSGIGGVVGVSSPITASSTSPMMDSLNHRMRNGMSNSETGNRGPICGRCGRNPNTGGQGNGCLVCSPKIKSPLAPSY